MSMIFVHLFHDNFGDNHVFLSSYWSKTIEREKRREDKSNMWIWERKLSQNGCTYIIFHIRMRKMTEWGKWLMVL